MGALDKIRRGTDSSGRPVYGTRQNFQFYDRVNERIGGKLVIVQGSWSNADASAGTHLLAMCMDYRTWNLTTAEVLTAVHFGRDLMGTMWWRTSADGMDPHIHNNLIGDAPAHWAALNQVTSYKAGRNGLANNYRDRDPYRPAAIRNYQYIEDDMTPDERAELFRIGKRLDAFADAEKGRDAAERERDKARFSALVTKMGGVVDTLAKIETKTSDAATKKQLREAREAILLELKNDPDIDGVDNPSDDFLAEENMG